MTKSKTVPASDPAETASAPTQPTEGGSYVRQEGGTLVREEPTREEEA